MKHSVYCKCDLCLQEKEDKLMKASKILEFLGIPNDALTGQVNIIDLCNILTDEEKLKELVSKLKLKAFW